MRWVGGSEYPDPPARLISISAFREPSPDLLRRLRMLDDRAEAVYVGNGRWWVGRVKSGTPRQRHGRRLALRARESDGFRVGDRWPELRQGLLMAQGFGLVVDETVYGEPDDRLVSEFQKALYWERGDFKAETEEERIYREIVSDRKRETKNRERELGKWFHRRRGRGKVVFGAGSNSPRGRML